MAQKTAHGIKLQHIAKIHTTLHKKNGTRQQVAAHHKNTRKSSHTKIGARHQVAAHCKNTRKSLHKKSAQSKT